MAVSDHRSYGRAVTLLVLGVLILTVCAALYVFLARPSRAPLAISDEIASDEDARRMGADAQRLATLLTILLMSALLILLFVIGAYLVIRVGQLVARTPVGGKPTQYVDVWQRYRLTDEQIRAATAEDQHSEDSGPSPPEEPPPGPDPSHPVS